METIDLTDLGAILALDPAEQQAAVAQLEDQGEGALVKNYHKAMSIGFEVAVREVARLEQGDFVWRVFPAFLVAAEAATDAARRELRGVESAREDAASAAFQAAWSRGEDGMESYNSEWASWAKRHSAAYRTYSAARRAEQKARRAAARLMEL